MKSKLAKLALMATITLALTFTFSCSSGSDNGGNDPGGSSSPNGNSGGSSNNNSSNSSTNGNYCYGYSNYKDCNLVGGKWIFDEQYCLSGGGILVNTDYCKKNGIGIDNTPSDRPISSSTMPSSSSTTQSSSSVVPSSSSVIQSSSSSVNGDSYSSIGDVSSSSVVGVSSSSSVNSSSSLTPSSSSITPSSSSIVSSISSATPSSSSIVPPSSNSSGLCTGFVNGTTREHYGKNKPQFCDPRDGKKYVYVQIGTQTWMAENLNYAATGSKCGNGSTLIDANTATCDIYGRLYNWQTALSACPSGWRLPSNGDWNVLMKFVTPDCSDNSTCTGTGTKLKTTIRWNTGSGYKAGTDDFGFSALPGGLGNLNDNFSEVVGDSGRWWSSSEYDANNAYSRGMYYTNGNVSIYYSNKRGFLPSIRCIQD